MSVVLTEKQKRYAHLTIKNLKSKNPKPKKDLLKEAGYIETKNPHQIEKSANYRKYFREQIKEENLKDIHNRLLNAGTLRREMFDKKMSDGDIKKIVEESGMKLLKVRVEEVAFKGKCKVAYCKVPALDVIGRATDMAYKVLGSYAPEKKDIRTFNLNGLLKKLDNGEDIEDEYDDE